jgi:hypothetical protein
VSEQDHSHPKVIEIRNPDQPWPDNPEIPDLPPDDLFEFDDESDEDSGFGHFNDFEPPSDEDIDEENTLMLRRQRLFRWAAQAIAVAFSEIPDVEKVAAFGAVAQPLSEEVPRFRQFRRHGIPVLHECGDLDLAVWMSRLDKLKELKRAMARGLSILQDSPYGGVAHHQVDVHVFDSGSGDYRGRLCIFGQCPKPGKRECLVPGCGESLFLQQFAKYRFQRAQFQAEPKVILFDRRSRFLAPMPRIEGRLRPQKARGPQDGAPF